MITPGVGKTHLAVALAVAACSAGYSIYFTSLDEAVRSLRAAEQAGRFAKKLQTYLRPAVLVLDEVGYLQLDQAATNMVFQLISRRYERGSVILTSNNAFSEWGSVFADDVLATRSSTGSCTTATSSASTDPVTDSKTARHSP